MALMRFDPFREWDRAAEQAFRGACAMQQSMPMEAFRRGDEFFVALDMPGVAPDTVDVTVERILDSIRVTRRPLRQEDDEVLVEERPQGESEQQCHSVCFR